MADNTILTPGCQTTDEESVELLSDTVQYLEHDNFLSEFTTEEEKAVSRDNLGVYPKTAVYTKDETDTNISTSVSTALKDHLSTDDPHGTLNSVEQMIDGMVKDDGSTPFLAPQTGVDPTKDTHLTTKSFVEKLLKEHTKLTGTNDPHKLLPEVKSLLEKYVKSSDVYSKSQLYTQNEVDTLFKNYVKRNGTTPFTAAQVGIDPTIDSHLTTKRYVDKTLHSHLVDVDPHGFITILNQRLAYYAKLSNVYDKTQTYSRTQIDNLITKLVNEAIESAITSYQESVSDSISDIYAEKYVKQDGSTAFLAPQSGQDAIEEDQLVTLRQVNNITSNTPDYWITSGPVETTVGFVEDNSEVPAKMTLQEVCDAIFYGRSISINVDKSVTASTTTPITLCVHGSTSLIDVAYLYQNDTLIYTFSASDFSDGCTTVDSNTIIKDTEFKFQVVYTNGTILETTETVSCNMPVFIGLLPKWRTAGTVTMSYLQELATQDSTNNQFIDYSSPLTSVTFNYSFEDAELRHPFIVVPKSCGDLTTMITKSQSFGIEAFDIIESTYLLVSGIDDPVTYTIYVYRQALSNLNQDVTFNFENE